MSSEPPAPPEPRSDETVAQSTRIDDFLSGLSIVPVRNSRIAEIRYTSSDPVFSAAAANAVAKAYIQQNMELKFNTSKEAADWLGERLAEQRKAVEASEAALQAFKEKNGTVSVADSASDIVVARLTDLNAALTKAKTDRIVKESLYNQVRAAEGTGAIDSLPVVLSNDFIQKLRSDSRRPAAAAGTARRTLRPAPCRDDQDPHGDRERGRQAPSRDPEGDRFGESAVPGRSVGRTQPAGRARRAEVRSAQPQSAGHRGERAPA
ncbi:MAG: hypothetical protein QM736_02875 [Vicinamibacterales bacterium]